MVIRAGRERPEKILVAMHKLSGGRTELLKYEDIVVKAFEMFPDEFALRGHPQYPDSSDIHKPLYGVLKRQGLVRAAQKTFALTTRGVELAERLIEHAGTSLDQVRDPKRLTRDVEAELDRMLHSPAFKLFETGSRDRILDTDFYAFLGCTVRTRKNDFVGRITASKDAIAVARSLGKPNATTARMLGELMAFLNERFGKEIKWKVAVHGA